MTEQEKKFGRGLNPETLKKMSQLSELKKQKHLKFRVIAKAVGPFTDQIRIENPNGQVELYFFENAQEK